MNKNTSSSGTVLSTGVKLKEFSVGPWWLNTPIWGGGWEVGKDPISQGWRKLRMHSGSDEFVLVGIPNQKGCFSARVMGDGKIDVALYDDCTPQEVLKGDSTFLDPVYMLVEPISGWGLEVLEKLKVLVNLNETMVG